MRIPIKESASKIFTGFLYGIGFCVATIFVFYVIDWIDMFESDSENDNDYEWVSFDESANLNIVSQSIISRDSDKVEVIGVVQNDSDVHWDSLRFEIELYDTNGNFVYECFDSIASRIKPGEKENFKLSCSNCNGSIPAFSDLKIKVVDAEGKKY